MLTEGAYDGCETEAPATSVAQLAQTRQRRNRTMRLRATCGVSKPHRFSSPDGRCQHLPQRFSVAVIQLRVRARLVARHGRILGKPDTARRGGALPMKVAAHNFNGAKPKGVRRALAARYARIVHAARFLCIGVFADPGSPRIQSVAGPAIPVAPARAWARAPAATVTMTPPSEPQLDAVPIIYTPSVEPQTLTAAGRVFALAVALGALSVLVIAMRLSPSHNGTGTHLQMGFERCQFLRTTNLPCPSCGMTTSFSHFAHGNWLASLYVQPGGFVLALACGAVFWAGLYAAITASPLQRLLRQVPAIYSVTTLLGFFIAAWGWKIFIHLKGVDGWH